MVRKMEPGEYIKIRREALRLTQKDLSERLEQMGIDKAATTISSWEAGRGPVPVDVIPALAQALEEPSPLRFYELSGILDNIPGKEVVKLLENASLDDIQMVYELALILLRKKNR